MGSSIEGIILPILVDSLEGDIHKKYGLLPNMIYVINRQGIIVYKSDWTDAGELNQIFDNLIEWEQAKTEGRKFRVSYGERLRYVDNDGQVRPRVLQRAGEKALKDINKALGTSSS